MHSHSISLETVTFLDHTGGTRVLLSTRVYNYCTEYSTVQYYSSTFRRKAAKALFLRRYSIAVVRAREAGGLYVNDFRRRQKEMSENR